MLFTPVSLWPAEPPKSCFHTFPSITKMKKTQNSKETDFGLSQGLTKTLVFIRVQKNPRDPVLLQQPPQTTLLDPYPSGNGFISWV